MISYDTEYYLEGNLDGNIRATKYGVSTDCEIEPLYTINASFSFDSIGLSFADYRVGSW